MGRTNAGSPGISGSGYYYYLFKLRLKEANQSLQILVDKTSLEGKFLEKRMEEDDPGGGGREDRRGSTAGTNTDITRSETSGDHNSREAEIRTNVETLQQSLATKEKEEQVKERNRMIEELRKDLRKQEILNVELQKSQVTIVAEIGNGTAAVGRAEKTGEEAEKAKKKNRREKSNTVRSIWRRDVR